MRKKGAFIRGRRFLEVGRLFEAIRYVTFVKNAANLTSFQNRLMMYIALAKYFTASHVIETNIYSFCTIPVSVHCFPVTTENIFLENNIFPK